MRTFTKGAAGLVAAASLLASVPAAAAGCWKAEGATAAKVRDLQSRLMVATLRCRAIGADIEGSYSSFVRSNREAIQAANAVLKAQFATGDRLGERAYDSFATALANQYGADATTPELCQAAAAAAEDAAAAGGDVARLLAVADRLGPPPPLPGGPCEAGFASAMHAVVDTMPEPAVQH
jgi:hypothetical protein